MLARELQQITAALRVKIENLIGKRKISSVIPVLTDLNDTIKAELAGE